MSALPGGPLNPGSLSDGKDAVTVDIVQVARERGVRALRGGGSVFAHHGLISPRIAPHVSMIVDPVHVRTLADGLVGEGWRPVPAPAHRILPRAIVALVSPDAGTFVHLHGVIPGFVVDPADTFDDLWDARATLTLRGVEIGILDRESTIAFAMHHRLAGQRAPRSRPGNRDFFRRQFASALDGAARAALLQRIQRLGATWELRELMGVLGVDDVEPPTVSAAYVSGRLALETPGDADVALLARLEAGRWAGVPRVPASALLGALPRALGASHRVDARDRPAPDTGTLAG